MYEVAWQARYEILRSCVLELHRVGILDKDSAAPFPFSQLPSQPQANLLFASMCLVLPVSSS